MVTYLVSPAPRKAKANDRLIASASENTATNRSNLGTIAFGTKVRKEHGLEAAQVMLGHSRADVTQVYAERNEALAATIAAKIG